MQSIIIIQSDFYNEIGYRAGAKAVNRGGVRAGIEIVYIYFYLYNKIKNAVHTENNIYNKQNDMFTTC